MHTHTLSTLSSVRSRLQAWQTVFSGWHSYLMPYSKHQRNNRGLWHSPVFFSSQVSTFQIKRFPPKDLVSDDFTRSCVSAYLMTNTIMFSTSCASTYENSASTWPALKKTMLLGINCCHGISGNFIRKEVEPFLLSNCVRITIKQLNLSCVMCTHIWHLTAAESQSVSLSVMSDSLWSRGL